jgi:ATP-dependent DNA helicase RecQ
MMIVPLLLCLFDHPFGLSDPFSIVICDSLRISLILDQKLRLCQLGLSAETTCSSRSQTAFADITCGKAQIVLTSPESLLKNTDFRYMLSNETYSKYLRAVIIDEAHCMCKW